MFDRTINNYINSLIFQYLYLYAVTGVWEM